MTDFSNINMLPHQTPGISNQALVFMTVVKMFTSRTNILVKSAIFNSTPAENGSLLDLLYTCTLKLSEKPHFYNLG